MNGRKSFGFKHKAALHRGLRRRVNRLISGVNFTSCAGPEKQGIRTKLRATKRRHKRAKPNPRRHRFWLSFLRIAQEACNRLNRDIGGSLRHCIACASIFCACCNPSAAPPIAESRAMTEGSTNGSQANVPAAPPVADNSGGGSSPKLRGMDGNPQGHVGPLLWQSFRDAVAHLHTVSLPDPSEEARFGLSSRTYATPQAMLMRCQGTKFIMTRGPALIAPGADQLLIMLQIEGSVDRHCAGRRMRIEPGDIAITDYTRPSHSVATDYENLIVVLARDSVPAALLALEPHGLIFPRGSGAARLIGAAMRELYAQADDLTVSEAEAAVQGILALTTACARIRLAGDELDHVKSKRKAALDYIDAHLWNAQLDPDEIAEATNLSRASLYRLLAAEGGIRALLLKRRLDEALRLMLEDHKGERSLKEIVKRCGFGGTSQFTRAFRARFGAPPRQYRALVRQQDLDWHEARLMADGFEQDAFLWRQQGLNGSKPPGAPG
jgi:AraC-like DNA-binding protein